ncbi:MAG: alpha-2-macroglobulin family protein [Pseudomonadota bacterium]|nr:alpha-2-macroglobulin family protein [Pseudomonadota bacterium]
MSRPTLLILAALPLLAARVPLEAAPPASPRLALTPASRAFYARPITTWFEQHKGVAAYLQVDRPLYRPGDRVSFRGWELGTHDFGAVEGGRTVRLLDPQGATVATHAGRGGSVTIPALAAGGEWKLQLLDAARVVAERSIVVRTVEIPKFKLSLEAPGEAVAPGATVTLPFQAHRATGEALAGAEVVVLVQAGGRAVRRTQVKLNAEGRATIEITAPVDATDASVTVMVTDGGLTESVTRPVPLRARKLALTVYPEGGALVGGVESRVYLQVRGPRGEAVAAEGTVTDGKGRPVTTWRTELDGRGSFSLTPEFGQTYVMASTVDGVRSVASLPTSQPDGCVVRTYEDDGSGPIRAEVRCASPRAVVVVGTQRGALLDIARVDVAPDAPGVVYLEATDAALRTAPGVARVTVFDGQAPLSERVLFRNREETLRVDVVPDRESYEPGETVGLELRASTRAGVPVAADLALSVVDDNLLAFAADDAAGLVESALLAAEVPGKIEDIRHYFDREDPNAARAMDLLLATQGWRRFDWSGAFLGGAKARADEAERARVGDDVTEVPEGTVLTKEFLQRIPSGRSYQTVAPMAAGRIGNAKAPPSPAPTSAPVARVFASAPSVRADFRETVYWNGDVHTDASGRARVSFPLSDAVGTFRVQVEGAGGGLVGCGEEVLRSSLPLSLDVKLPEAMTQGDRPLLPVVVTNDTPGAVDVALTADWGGLLAPVGTAPTSLQVGAGARASAWFPLEVVASGKGAVTLAGQAGRHGDAFTRTIEVQPRGFPQERAAAGTLAGRADTVIELPTWLEGTLTASVELYPSPVATMVSGLGGMLREPAGCFEQASSTNYPNVMILRYLQTRSEPPGEVAARASALLESGYRRLTAYEAQSGGYEWFGASPGHEALTAYGLLEFADMRAVYPQLEGAMVDRTASWLIGQRRDGKGGFLRNDRALDSFGRASVVVTDAYITWSLVQAGYGAKMRPELDAIAALGETTADPYVLALVVGSLGRARPEAVARPLDRLLSLQAVDGSFPGAKESITRSGGEGLLVETTALAALALLDAEAGETAQRRAIDWIVGHRQAGGAWGSTQATVLALRALTTHAVAHRAPEAPGSVQVSVNGQPGGTLTWEAGQESAARLEGLEGLLRAGPNEITLSGGGGKALGYTVAVAYRTRAPITDQGAVIDISTSLASTRLKMGETVRLHADVRNLRSAGQPMTIARIGIPGGLSAQDSQLRALRDAGVIDFYETRPLEVDLYWRALGPSAERKVDLDLVATVPGTWQGPATSAYLYYTPERRSWEAPVSVMVEP